jgi:hypothetical protein
MKRSRGIRREGLRCSIRVDGGHTSRWSLTRRALFHKDGSANRLTGEQANRRAGEQAKDIACLANQLLNPALSPTKEKTAKKKGLRTDPAEIAVFTPLRLPCFNEYTDGHWESLVLRVGGAQATASAALSCSDAGRLEALLSSAVGAPFINAVGTQ